MATNGDSGGITGGTGGGASSMHGGRARPTRAPCRDGLNMGWAGANSNAAVRRTSPARRKSCSSTSGGLGEAETAGVVLNVIPRDGGNTFSGTFVFSGANGSMQSSNYTQALKDAGLRSPSELIKVYEINPMGGGRIVRDKLWFYLTYRESYAENTIPGMWFNKNARRPDANGWSISTPAGRRSTTPACGTTSGASRGRCRRATRSASMDPSSTARPTERAAARATRDAGSAGAEPLYARAHADAHVDARR